MSRVPFSEGTCARAKDAAMASRLDCLGCVVCVGHIHHNSSHAGAASRGKIVDPTSSSPRLTLSTALGGHLSPFDALSREADEVVHAEASHRRRDPNWKVAGEKNLRPTRRRHSRSEAKRPNYFLIGAAFVRSFSRGRQFMFTTVRSPPSSFRNARSPATPSTKNSLNERKIFGRHRAPPRLESVARVCWGATGRPRI